MGKALTDKEIAAYRANGFHAPLRVMSEEDALEYRRHLERIEAERPESLNKLDLKGNLLLPWMDRITRTPRMLDALEDIMGPNLLCWNASVRNKKAKSPTYAGWHQDTRYITIRPTGTIAFLALSPTNTDSGTVSVVPGSHKWDVLPHEDTHDKDSILTRGQYITAEFDKSSIAPLQLRPGECGFFDHNIVHSSGPNHTNDRRLVMLMGYFATKSKPMDDRRVSAFVVRGTDEYRYFDADRAPVEEFGPAELAAHREAVEVQAKKILYKDSDRQAIALS